MTDKPALAERLEDVISALRVLASTQRSDTAQTIAERADAVRAAGSAFEEVLVEQCISYTSVFADEGWDDWGSDGDEDEAGHEDEDDEDGIRLPPGTRLSVRVREDFVLVDEPAFRESAMRLFAEKGPWPPDVQPEDDVLTYLGAVVDRIGLQEVTLAVTGLQNAGGTTEVLVVDEALQEGEDW